MGLPAARPGRTTNGTRPHHWRSPRQRHRVAAALSTLAVVAAVLVAPLGTGPAAATGNTGTPAAHAAQTAAAQTVAAQAGPATTSPALVLNDQTVTVTAGQPTYFLHLRPATGALPTTQLGVSVTVYGCLSSVSGFDQSVTSSTPSGAVISSTPAPLPLATLPRSEDGSFDLSLPVEAPGSAATSTPASGFTITLTSTGSQCGGFPAGVYPVRVELVDTASGQGVGGFTTHLVYSNARPDTHKLLVALVLPIRTTIAPAPDPTTEALLRQPSAALAPPSAALTGGVIQTVGAVAANSAVPITMQVSPQALVALDAGGSPGTQAVAALASLSATPSHQFLRTPYAPVNAAMLVADGLDSELSRQVARGSDVLATIDRDASAPATAGSLGVWATGDGLDPATMTQLQANGYGQVVVPATAVSSPPTNGSAVEPFVLASSRGSPMGAVVANPDLAARFAGAPGNPVLAAHQLVAELAQIYYEKPNDTTLRASVVLPPASWTDNPLFVNALLKALTANPILQPATVESVFAALPATTCRTSCHLEPSGGSPTLPAAAIRTQRQRVDSFTAATPAARTESTQLSDLILAGESTALRPAQQGAVLRNARHALDAQVSQFFVAGDRTITLTSQQGTLPVDVVSSAHYPVAASLTVTSDKLLFPNRSTQWTRPGTVVLGPGTNIVEVPFTVRTSGQFTVDVTVRTPAGGLILSRGAITVRSAATSIVGVVLSVGALAVLAVWWIRTSRKRRAARRDSEDIPTGAPSDTPERV